MGESFAFLRTPLPKNDYGPSYKTKVSRKKHVTPVPENKMAVSEPESRYHKMRSLMDKGLD